MTLLKVCACALLCALFALCAGKGNTNIKTVLSIVAGVMIALSAIAEASPVLRYLSSLGADSSISLYIGILLRAIGATLICESASSVCRECGEGELASKVELFCRFEVIAICFPLLRAVLDSAQALIG